MAKEEAKKVSDPGVMWEAALNALIEDKPERVEVRGKEFSMTDLRRGTIRFLTDVQLTTEDKGDPKIHCKTAAAMRLNSWWGLRAFWGVAWKVLWRWYYYVREYSDKELWPYISLCKKKAELAMVAYTVNTTLTIAMKDTVMTKTKEEAKLIQAENTLEQLGQQQKSFPTSQPADTSSAGS